MHSSRDMTTVHSDIVTSDMAISIDDGIPLALIANELVANALEHAFPDEAAERFASGWLMRQRRRSMAEPVAHGELDVTDDGRAMPSEVFDAVETTGFTLIGPSPRNCTAR